jgi:hypothetical protein
MRILPRPSPRPRPLSSTSCQPSTQRPSALPAWHAETSVCAWQAPGHEETDTPAKAGICPKHPRRAITGQKLESGDSSGLTFPSLSFSLSSPRPWSPRRLLSPPARPPTAHPRSIGKHRIVLSTISEVISNFVISVPE